MSEPGFIDGTYGTPKKSRVLRQAEPGDLERPAVRHVLPSNELVSNAASTLAYLHPGTWLLHIGLFLLTFLTTTSFGSALVESFSRGHPLTLDSLVNSDIRLIHFSPAMWNGLYFSLPLLTILLAHELGHYVECQRRRVDASLPFFLPSPLTLGTFGAFIRIRSPIYTREGLFDIGIRGPMTGFIVLIPFLVAGVALSRVTASLPPNDSVLFGTPLALRLVEWLRFPGVPASHILLHPMAMAAWAGLFATALNLLPIGQLDGGHIVYAAGSERWHRRIGFAVLAALVIAGFSYWPWWCWGAVMFFFGRRHPLVFDAAPLRRGRLLLCLAAVIVFILSATVVPVRSI